MSHPKFPDTRIRRKDWFVLGICTLMAIASIGFLAVVLGWKH